MTISKMYGTAVKKVHFTICITTDGMLDLQSNDSRYC